MKKSVDLQDLLWYIKGVKKRRREIQMKKFNAPIPNAPKAPDAKPAKNAKAPKSPKAPKAPKTKPGRPATMQNLTYTVKCRSRAEVIRLELVANLSKPKAERLSQTEIAKKHGTTVQLVSEQKPWFDRLVKA